MTDAVGCPEASGPVTCVAVFTHQLPIVAHATLLEVLALLREREVAVLVPPGEAEKHPELVDQGGTHCCRTREELAEAELCLVLGGDGTMLRTLRFTRGLGVPVAGVNLGRVGFFTAVRRDHVAEDLVRILDGEYVNHALLGLAAELDGQQLRAVNDVVVGRSRDGGICRLSYSLNGVALYNLPCDGLIVATPAGSTAYNLAAGGPVLGIELAAYVLTYLAAHTLGVRPLVAAANDVLNVRNESTHSPVEVTVDGEPVGTLGPRERLEVVTVPGLACLALLPENNFYSSFADRFL